MRKLFTSALFMLLLAAGVFAQGGSATAPTLKVSDGTRSFNGVNELRVPAGCVTFSGRTAIINCTTGSGSSGTTSSQNANLFFASPNGAYGLPSWRAIVEADLPSINASKIGAGTIATARLGSGTANSTTYLRGDQTWATVTGGSGTVESVGLALPSEFSVTGSPVTTTGTLTGAWANQTTNKVFAAPSGSTGTPTFRALVEADIPDLSAAKLTSGTLPAARMPALTGDVTTAAGAVATTLANSGVSAGTYTNPTVTFDAKGRATSATSAPAVPAVRAYNSTAYGVPHNSFVAVPLDSERYDSDNIHSNVTNNSRLTAQTAGFYSIDAAIAFAVNASGVRQAGIRLNGTTYIGLWTNLSPNGVNEVYFTLNAQYYLNVGDYVELLVYQSSGTTVNVNAAGNYSPEFSMALHR